MIYLLIPIKKLIFMTDYNYKFNSFVKSVKNFKRHYYIRIWRKEGDQQNFFTTL